MKSYFRIPFAESKTEAVASLLNLITKGDACYLCVVDGVLSSTSVREQEMSQILNSSAFNVCDSNYIPLYTKLVYRARIEHISGDWLLREFRKNYGYRMAFVGGTPEVLQTLQRRLEIEDSPEDRYLFLRLPFMEVEDFDYANLASHLNDFNPDIIWVSLGAPKQEKFASRLSDLLNRGIVIPVGAVFGYQSGLTHYKRCPRFIRRLRLEFLYRLCQNRHRQWPRIWLIITTLPRLIQLGINDYSLKFRNPFVRYAK